MKCDTLIYGLLCHGGTEFDPNNKKKKREEKGKPAWDPTFISSNKSAPGPQQPS